MTRTPGGNLVHLNPILAVSDLNVSIAFYTENLGFEQRHSFGDPPDFAIIGHGEHEIYLCLEGQGQPGTWLGLFVDDPAGLHDDLVAKGVQPITRLESEFRVEDPDGHVLRVFLSA